MRYYVEEAGKRSTRFYRLEAGARKRAKLRSLISEGFPVTAVAEEYRREKADYEVVGRATYVCGGLDTESGTLARIETGTAETVKQGSVPKG